jgi:hypothetical protein
MKGRKQILGTAMKSASHGSTIIYEQMNKSPNKIKGIKRK